MTKQNKFCQSCGMPMKQDPKLGGSNEDGSKNELYCSYCYKEGKFTYEGSMEDFKNMCVEKMVESGKSRWFSKFLMAMSGLSRLERWKK